jgi:Uma2 family endonuclease
MGSAPLKEMSTTAKTFTADEFYRLEELGFLEGNERFELLDGRIVHRHDDVGPAHLSVVVRMTEKFVLALGDQATVFPQVSLRLTPRSTPLPDIYVAPKRADYYRSGGPTLDELEAVVEVADSSLAIDRGEKLRIYARAGVREYWIANLRAWTIEKHRLPNARGYGEVKPYAGSDEIRFDAYPGVRFAVDDLLGPRA